jgi:hypothetical protein
MYHVRKFRCEIGRQIRPLLPIAAVFTALSVARVLGF